MQRLQALQQTVHSSMAHHRLSNTLDYCYRTDDMTNDACAGIHTSQVVLQQLREEKHHPQ